MESPNIAFYSGFEPSMYFLNDEKLALTVLGDTSSESGTVAGSASPGASPRPHPVADPNQWDTENSQNKVFKTESDSGSDRPPLAELLEEAELKRKRLDRKAELARLSRKRKKTRVQELESEVEELKEQLSRERMKVAELETESLKNASSKTVDVDHRLKATFQKVCLGTDNISDAASLVKDFLDAHRSKNSCNEVQMSGFENSLGSNIVHSFVRWIMHQNDKFFDDPSGLWRSVFGQTLRCSTAQLQQFQELRRGLRGKLQQWNDIETALTTIWPLLRSYYRETPATLESFLSILAPSQSGQLFQWIARYGEVCVKIRS